jgi:hypothetical protein
MTSLSEPGLSYTSPADSKLPDMSLTVSLVVNGSISGTTPSVTAQYSQSASNPESDNVVDPSGDINLANMAWNSGFSVDTDITFNLSGQITDQNGNPLAFNFPSDPDQACTITRIGGGKNNQIRPKSGATLMQLIIDDDDKDPTSYNYVLSLTVATQPNPTIVHLDPRIVNR